MTDEQTPPQEDEGQIEPQDENKKLINVLAIIYWIIFATILVFSFIDLMETVTYSLFLLWGSLMIGRSFLSPHRHAFMNHLDKLFGFSVIVLGIFFLLKDHL